LPDEPDSHYNLPTLRLLRGETDDALAALERDVELGDRDVEFLQGDPAFESLHDDPRFRASIERMRAPAEGAR
jgi:hypothetical protein